MSKRRPTKEPIPRHVDNIEEWYPEVLGNQETTTETLEAIAKLADTDSEFAEMLATDFLAFATLLVEHENATPAIISYVLELVSRNWKRGGYVMQAIAERPDCTAETLETLFLNGDMYVRDMVIRHSNVTRDIVMRAAKDEQEYVRRWFTYDHENAPDEAFQYIAENDPAEDIRRSAIAERGAATEAARSHLGFVLNHLHRPVSGC